jgi:hypothetical protein
MIQKFFEIVQRAIDQDIGSRPGLRGYVAVQKYDSWRARPAGALPKTLPGCLAGWFQPASNRPKGSVEVPGYPGQAVSMQSKSVAIRPAVVVVCRIFCQM